MYSCAVANMCFYVGLYIFVLVWGIGKKYFCLSSAITKRAEPAML